MKPSLPLRIFISHPSHHLTDCEPHGDGLLAQEYIRRLAERGHELHVAVPVMTVQKQFPASVHLYPVPSWTSVSTVNPAALNRLEYAVRVRSLCVRLQRTIAFDLIHQLNPVVPGMSLFLAGRGLPIVLGPLPAPGSGAVDRNLTQRAKLLVLHKQIRDSAMLLIPSLAAMTLVPADAASRGKVRVLHYGIDTALFQPLPQNEKAECSVLFLANLVPRKGVLLLLDAFEIIAARHPRCVLCIAGSGPLAQELTARVETSPRRERIRFLGNVPRAEVPAVLNQATVYCLPSYSEPFGMTALEAMSCGKPVVATSVSGLGQLLKDSPLLVGAGDRNALANALDQVLSSVSLQESEGRQNRNLAEKEYSWDVVIDRLELLYSEMLSTKQE